MPFNGYGTHIVNAEGYEKLVNTSVKLYELVSESCCERNRIRYFFEKADVQRESFGRPSPTPVKAACATGHLQSSRLLNRFLRVRTTCWI